MAIQNNTNDLVDNIFNKLKNAKLLIPTFDSGGQLLPEAQWQKVDYVSETTQSKNVNFESITIEGSGTPRVEPYSTSSEVGLRVMVSAIVKETVQHIVNNTELVSKARYDALEKDFNQLITSLAVLSTSIASPDVGAVAVTLQPSIVTRAGLKASETVQGTDIK